MDRIFTNTEFPADVDTAPLGLVFDIKRFALHDGPGIRTSVFFKGCPLRCEWCHNPESRDASPHVLVDQARCTQCGACIETCPQGAVQHDEEYVKAEPPRCTACGNCVPACPQEARHLVGVRRSAQQILDIVNADTVYYTEQSGITLSGGEPLAQPDFALALLDACSHHGIHRAVDTCGYAPASVVEAIAERTDLFLYDLKLMDDERHLNATGCSNHVILDNLRFLDSHGSDLWIRIPLIPGINDDRENLHDICKFLSSCASLQHVQLLPYHRGGTSKQHRWGFAPSFSAHPHPPEHLAELHAFAQSHCRHPVVLGGAS